MWLVLCGSLLGPSVGAGKKGPVVARESLIAPLELANLAFYHTVE